MKKNWHSGLSFEIHQFVYTLSEKLKLRKLRFLPRWIIFSLDVASVVLGLLLSYIILKGVGVNFESTLSFSLLSILFVAVNATAFWIFKTYRGIVRHSTILDTIKLAVAQSCVFLSLVIINLVYNLITEEKLFLNTLLFLSTTMTFCFLIFYRIAVRQIYDIATSRNKDLGLLPVMVLTNSDNAVSIYNALKAEKNKRFKVIGFIESDRDNKYSTLLGLPVFNLNRRVSAVLRYSKASGLIITDNHLSNTETLTLVEDCLQFNYKVFKLPTITNWQETTNLSSKVRSIKIQDLLERKPIQLDNSKISTHLENKTILVTGAAGSIGSEIVWQVCRFRPDKVILIDQAETPLHHISLELEKANLPTTIISLIADIRDYGLMEKIFKKYSPDVVYHAAAYKHVPLMEENPCQAIFTNILGSKNVADLAYKYNVSRFVMVSTDKAVNPSNVMGASKRTAEKYVQSLALKANLENKTKYITTRFGNVLGSNGSVVPLFTKQIENGGPITITHPDIIRYFMTIPEACQLVLEAGSMGNGGEIYIFDMGKPVKIIDLAHKMIKLAGLTPEEDIKIKIIGLRPGEKLYEELLNDSATTLPTHHEKIMISQDLTDSYSSISKNIEILIDYAEKFAYLDAVKQLKVIVPEFKSLNSEFSKFD